METILIATEKGGGFETVDSVTLAFRADDKRGQTESKQKGKITK